MKGISIRCSEKSRSSCSQVFFKIDVLESFEIFTGKHLCWSLFLIKLHAQKGCNFIKKRPQHMFSCEYCEIFKNSFFYRASPVAASEIPLDTSV